MTDFSTLAAKQSEYNALIEEVKDSYTYTKASLDVLSAAVAEAKTMINEGKATQAEADAMLKKLNDAYDSLIPYVASEGVEIGYYEAEGVTNPNPGYFRYTGTFINGKSISLVANEQPKDSVYKSVEWSSSNSNVTVSESGVVTNNSASAQAADITCTITNEKDESYSSTVTVTFVRYGVTGISFADEKVFGAPAQTVTLSPKFELGGNISVIKDCKYVSDNKDIATVDENGVVTFITQGCATITVTAKDGGYTATIKAYTTWDTAALKAAIDEASKINPQGIIILHSDIFYSSYAIGRLSVRNRTVSVKRLRLRKRYECTNTKYYSQGNQGKVFIHKYTSLDAWWHRYVFPKRFLYHGYGKYQPVLKLPDNIRYHMYASCSKYQHE